MLFSLPQCVQELKGLMEEVKTLKAERETIESELKEPIADISESCDCHVITTCLSCDHNRMVV